MIVYYNIRLKSSPDLNFLQKRLGAPNEILGVDEKRQNVIQFTQNKERYSSLYGMVVSGNNIHFLFSSCVI